MDVFCVFAESGVQMQKHAESGVQMQKHAEIYVSRIGKCLFPAFYLLLLNFTCVSLFEKLKKLKKKSLLWKSKNKKI
jgi:hypothetical protein